MTALLQVQELQTFYGDAQALFGVGLSVAEGEFVTMLGRNGMGKTTTVSSIMGIRPARGGRIMFAGQDITRLPSHQIARLGVGLVPEQRQVFPNLTVHENLVATAHNRLRRCTRTWSPRRTTGCAARSPGPCSGSMRCFRACRSAAVTWGPTSPVASNKCWRLAVRS